MVFASYNSASYLLPLDNDQSVSFYRNENRLFPTAIGPSAGGVGAPPPGRNNSTTSANDMSITDMLTAAYHHEMQQQHQTVSGGGAGGGGSNGTSGGNMNAGDCPFGRVQSPPTAQHHQQPQLHRQQQQQQLSVYPYHRFGGTVAMCDDFQPVGYFNGSSNGYYGFVPSLAPTGGGTDAGGHSSNNNVLPGAAVNNNRPPATTANVNGHLSAIDFHGNQHHHHRISCNAEAGEQNNNNNNNNADDEGIFHVQPFAAQQIPRKRKELNQPEDEEMDTNVQLTAGGHQYPKRRKTDPETVAVDGGMGFPVPTSVSFAGHHAAVGGVSYQHQAEVHNPAVDEMECQDQPAQQHPAVTLQPTTNGFHAVDVHHPAGQQPTSKKEG
ncbi:RCC1 domain-containing protein DDB_G0279253-like isoform X2 [Anopheles stephensi]|uniref:RCC1 domain-containing protein DDB_G0279253-like isoform X2 n=1 Tax=Anopheles stephensi TaxID=30069 RepID=UPI001658894C|nr:RCC1 domain-containing protein DDB_G0279253-like isoform X2 [Anopheles stephensi]